MGYVSVTGKLTMVFRYMMIALRQTTIDTSKRSRLFMALISNTREKPRKLQLSFGIPDVSKPVWNVGKEATAIFPWIYTLSRNSFCSSSSTHFYSGI